MKLNSYLILTLCFLACSSEPDYNGVWVSCCSHTKNDSTLIFTGAGSQKYLLFDDEYFEYGEYLNGSTTYINSKYKIKNKQIYIDNNKDPWFDFHFMNSDEIRYTNPNNVVLIYKRLNDSLKYKGNGKLNLIDKRFKVSHYKEIIDTAYFKNDSIISWSSRLKNTGADKWIINDISGYKILSIQWLGQSAIYKTENDKIFLRSFEKTPIDITFEEIK